MPCKYSNCVTLDPCWVDLAATINNKSIQSSIEVSIMFCSICSIFGSKNKPKVGQSKCQFSRSKAVKSCNYVLQSKVVPTDAYKSLVSTQIIEKMKLYGKKKVRFDPYSFICYYEVLALQLWPAYSNAMIISQLDLHKCA